MAFVRVKTFYTSDEIWINTDHVAFVGDSDQVEGATDIQFGHAADLELTIAGSAEDFLGVSDRDGSTTVRITP